MVAILLMAFALRLTYALRISPYSDEFITMVAARAVLQTGAPILPSGLFYDHGILFVYVDALFLGLIGFTEDMARVASVFIGVLTVALVYTFGRRWFTARTGFLAALLLVFSSEAIIWHGRARMYSLLQFCFCAGAFLLYGGLVMHDRRLYRCIGVAAVTCAVLAHLLAVLYALTMLIGLLVACGWVRRRRIGFSFRVWQLWPELLLGVVGGGMVVLARLVGGPWGVGGRVVFDLAVLTDIGCLVRQMVAWMHLFIIWPNMVWTAVILVGVLALLLRLVHRQGRQDDPHWVYLFITWLGSVVGLAAFSVWHADAYLFGVLPFFYLLSARVLDALCDVVEEAAGRSRARRAVAVASTVATVGLVILLGWPSALEMIRYDPLQLDQALEYVRLHWREGDTVATFAPPASLITLGHVDFYAQERGGESVETEAGRVDIWTGAPLLDSAEALDQVLDTRERVWLIAHREDWQRYYSAAYCELVEARMERVFDGTGTLVYLSRP